MSISAEASGQWIASGVLFSSFLIFGRVDLFGYIVEWKFSKKGKRNKGCNMHLLCHFAHLVSKILMKRDIFDNFQSVVSGLK